MAGSGDHRFSGEGALQKHVRGERGLQESVYGHGGGDGAGRTSSHPCGERKAFVNLELQPDAGIELPQYGLGRSPSGIPLGLAGEPPLVPTDGGDSHPRLGGSARQDLVARIAERHAQDVEPACQIPDGPGCESPAFGDSDHDPPFGKDPFHDSPSREYGTRQSEASFSLVR
jgi:hypothetical protein